MRHRSILLASAAVVLALAQPALAAQARDATQVPEAQAWSAQDGGSPHAAESWTRRAWGDAERGLQSIAGATRGTAGWADAKASSAASTVTRDARAFGGELARGGAWASGEVERALHALGGAPRHAAASGGSKAAASPFDEGA